jgi:glutamate racemase
MLQNRGFKDIFSIATPLFVPLVEEEIVEGKIVDEVFELYFKNIKKQQIDYIILGCTHYPFLEKSFNKHFPNAKLIHSGQAIVGLLKNEFNLKENKTSTIKLYASDNPEELRQKAKLWLQ